MPNITLDYTPQPKQKILHASTARQIFYGGAAGGGKSHCIRWDAYIFCLQNPGLQAYLFRKTQPELEDNHVKWARTEIPRELGEVVGKPARVAWYNGSALYFCYAEYEKDIYRYLGAEMHWVGLDEASLMLPAQIGFLKTRNRLGGFKPHPEYAQALPRFIMASNPGGPSHYYLKKTFITPGCPMQVFHDPKMKDPRKEDDPGWRSLFIPAKMEDNDYLDEDYGSAFSALPPELAKAYREGDWDVVVGQALHTLSREKHMVRKFDIPRHWTRFMSIDWGTAAPYSVCWLAVSDGALVKGKMGFQDVYIPPGALVLYRELYGWDGEDYNKGSREDARTVARKVLSVEKGEVIDYRIGDSEMWAQRGTMSIQEAMNKATHGRFFMKPSKKDRKQGYSEFLCRLAGSSNYMETGDEGEWPMFFAMEHCHAFWNTVPPLVLDETDPDKGPETSKQADHVYDSLVYGFRSRPYTLTERDRYLIERGPEIEAAKRGGRRTGYATA